MATAQDIIDFAYKKIGVLGRGRTLPTELADDGLIELNDMIAEWSENETLIIPHRVQQNHALTQGQASYTWGTGAQFNGARPLEVHAAWIRDSGGLDHPLERMTVEEWARITLKTEQARPDRYYFEPQETDAQITFDSPPKEASDVFYARVLVPLTGFATLGTADSVPEGYLSALKWNLALRFAPGHGREARPTVVRLADDTKQSIKRKNRKYRVPIAELDRGLRPAQRYSINQG